MFERVRADYVEKPDDQKLVQYALNAMLAGLDPHSSYMDAKSFRDMQIETRGKFGGLGIEISKDEGLIRVVAPIDETPAAKAGIMANDIITHINEEPVQNLTLDQAVDQNTRPREHSDQAQNPASWGQDKPVELSITRQIIRVRPVSSRLDGDDVGFIPINQFNEHTADDLKQAISHLELGAGAKLKGFILDLRNNPGGLLDQAILVRCFPGEGGDRINPRPQCAAESGIQCARGRPHQGQAPYCSHQWGSASASEIVAGALQDHRRATVIGSRSFGKGSVQISIPLGSGNGALRLTTARYFTPSGRSIQAKGIAPDIEVLQEVPEYFKARGTYPWRGRAPRPPQGRR